MRFLHLTLLLYCVLNVSSSAPALEYPTSSPTRILKPITFNPITTNDVKPGTNIIFQSNDGGQTWQDVSDGLPEMEQPVGFFEGESDLYVHGKNVLYSSKRNLKTPVWEKDNITAEQYRVLSHPVRLLSIVPVSWPSTHTIRTIFEALDGSVFIGYDRLLYKSTDKGKNWKLIQNEAMYIVESEGVLMAAGTKGIARSTDMGEHWEWVISEGGGGIAIEHIEGGVAAITYNTITKSRRIRISMDNGKTWKAIDEGLRPSLSITSIKQMGKYLICGHPDGIFRSSDMGKTWNKVHSSVNGTSDFTYTVNEKVFVLYVSGNTVYAVASIFGC